jgi:hypothetical protein
MVFERFRSSLPATRLQGGDHLVFDATHQTAGGGGLRGVLRYSARRGQANGQR